MARGHQKEQSQQKNAAKKQKDASSGSQLNAQKSALKFMCPNCKLQMTNYNTFKTHFEAKHPKDNCPAPEAFQ